MTSPELNLKCARVAYPHIDWVTTNGVVQKNPLSAGILVPQYFDPHDPTKGDLAALNEALEREGWRFYYLSASRSFAAANAELESIRYAPTPAERAIKCVEAMP